MGYIKEKAAGMADETLTAALNKLRDLKWAKQDHERELRELEMEISAQEDACVQLMDQSGVRSVKLQDATFSRTTKAHPTVVDNDALNADLEKRGLGMLIKHAVPWTTLRAQINEMTERGEAPLDGVDNTPKEGVTVRRAGKKEE